ncbi:hypothetical protein ILYODFUR_025415 [Ilyodon furcidens]|uniref:Uncharacterized protein n=1 Tax=Ilyodon furcidens TaxID=33524 RepID=A0ABV0UKE0_9TELE
MRTLSTLLQASQDSPATAVLHSHLSPGSQPLSLADLTLPNSPCYCGFLHQIQNKSFIKRFSVSSYFSACGSSRPSTL